RKAAEQGYVNAQFKLGLAYFLGQGVSQDYAQAAQWFRKAAEQGLPEAQFILGVAYLHGLGVPQDYIQAHMWLNLAASQGMKKAAEDRDKLSQKMIPEQIAKAQKLAAEWWEAHKAKDAK
ncbi:MAG: sel1 repeat family protein, partial [Deltaproteobacteria bacterium]|nr:sel1 repeat family protein [Deltaproteobacteria bacterium]